MHRVVIDVDVLSVEMGNDGLVVYAQKSNLVECDATYDLLMAVCSQISRKVA